MSIVPFILKDPGRTVVLSQEDFDLNGPRILIQEFDQEQVRDTKSSNVSYGLRVGDSYQDHRANKKQILSEGGDIVLQPGDAVIIKSMEAVRFPKKRFGHIVPKVSLLQEGISNTSSKIDPGYNGHLLITVFNLGKRTVTLRRGEEFCTLYVLDIKDGAIAYDKPGKELQGTTGSTFFQNLADFIERQQTYFTIVLTLVTIALTAATLTLTIAPIKENSVTPKQELQGDPRT